MAAQYRRSAQPRGYRPRRVDQSNIQRMREDTNRTVQGMRQRAEMEIADRRRVLAQQKEDQAATRRMEEKNFQIQTQNSQNELRGLQLQAQTQAQQAAIDAKASAQVFETISNLSVTAAGIYSQIQENQKQQDYNREAGDSSSDAGIAAGLAIKEDNAAQATAQLGAVQNFESKGGDPYIAAKVKANNPNMQAVYSLAQLDGFVSRGGFDTTVFNRIRQMESALGEGRILQYEDKRRAVAEVQSSIMGMLKDTGYSPQMVGAFIAKMNGRAATLLGGYRREDQQIYDNQRLNQALTIIQDSPSEDLPANWSAAWSNIVDYYKGDRRQAWEAVKPTFTAIDENGNYLRSMEDIDKLPLYTDEGVTTFGERFSNRSGQAVGIRREIIADRNRLRVQYENQQEQAQRASNKDLEDELARAFLVKPTAKNGQELLRQYSELTGGESSTQLTNLIKYNSIEVTQRQNEFERIASKPDNQLTQEDVDIAKTVNPGQAAVIEQRYQSGAGKFRTKEVDAQIKTGLTTITGTTDFGTTKSGKPGSLGAQLYFRAQVIQKADLYYGDGNQGFTVEEAVAKAVADETEIYQSQYQTKGTKYFRKVEPNGTVSYPWIDARAGNVTAAEKALRDYNSLRTMVKEVGFNAVANVPNSYMTAERMEYIAQNPTAEPDALETAMVRMSPGFALHEIRNKAFAAAGRRERFGPPEVISGINFTPEQQAIINDARSSYQSKLNAVNVASGNTAVYQAPSHMRRGFMLRKTATSNSISSVLDQLTDADWDELGYVVSGEAARNTDDEYGVAANVLTRLVAGTYGKTIADIIRQPDQYEAVTIGTARYEPELSKKLKSPEGREKIKRFFELLDGRTEFKGQSQLRNRVPDEDPMFAPTGNFYHYAGQ